MINCIDQQYTVVCFIFPSFFSLCCAYVVYSSIEFILSLMLSAFEKNLVTQYSPYVLTVKNICGNIFPHKGEHYIDGP